ncbi:MULTISPECIES: hypothetical protein [Aerosakkonema]|uniref:hypothetical protein n=1 Tax=Aerosakkonema TaxID=1246629 RepID=UPI0035B9B0B5
MNIDSIEQEAIADTDTIMTTVVISAVASQCVLARQMIDILGRPGIDNDMEFIGSGERWAISWTQPKLTLNETKTLVNKAIYPKVGTI